MSTSSTPWGTRLSIRRHLPSRYTAGPCRLKDYDPDRHLGEVIYLFCRDPRAQPRIWRRPIEANGVLARGAAYAPNDIGRRPEAD